MGKGKEKQALPLVPYNTLHMLSSIPVIRFYLSLTDPFDKGLAYLAFGPYAIAMMLLRLIDYV